MTYLGRLRTHVPSLSCEFAISTVLFWKKICYGKPQYMCFKFIKTKVECTLVQSECTAVVVVICCPKPSWRHGFCHLLIFSVFPKVLSFFVSAHEKLQDGQITAVICNTIQSLVTAEISDSEIFLKAKVSESERLNRKQTLDVRTHYKKTETFEYLIICVIHQAQRKDS